MSFYFLNLGLYLLCYIVLLLFKCEYNPLLMINLLNEFLFNRVLLLYEPQYDCFHPLDPLLLLTLSLFPENRLLCSDLLQLLLESCPQVILLLFYHQL
jgi:hypothetical protein